MFWNRKEKKNQAAKTKPSGGRGAMDDAASSSDGERPFQLEGDAVRLSGDVIAAPLEPTFASIIAVETSRRITEATLRSGVPLYQPAVEEALVNRSIAESHAGAVIALDPERATDRAMLLEVDRLEVAHLEHVEGERRAVVAREDKQRTLAASPAPSRMRWWGVAALVVLFGALVTSLSIAAFGTALEELLIRPYMSALYEKDAGLFSVAFALVTAVATGLALHVVLPLVALVAGGNSRFVKWGIPILMLAAEVQLVIATVSARLGGVADEQVGFLALPLAERGFVVAAGFLEAGALLIAAIVLKLVIDFSVRHELAQKAHILALRASDLAVAHAAEAHERMVEARKQRDAQLLALQVREEAALKHQRAEDLARTTTQAAYRDGVLQVQRGVYASSQQQVLDSLDRESPLGGSVTGASTIH